MTGRVALTFFEVDIKYCAKTFGATTVAGTCDAELGVTGDHKCFNTRNFECDCQDIPNYSEEYLTLRFGMEGQPFVASMPCLPYMTSCKVQNAEVHPGEDIGIRSTFNVSMLNAPHSDAGIDKYIADRAYNPYEQGTFWGRFRARNPYLEHVPCRVKRGFVGDTEFDTEHFVLSSMAGPNSNGEVRLNGFDFMYLLGAKSAQAPSASQGYLSVSYPSGSTSITLEPSGIGSEYPAAGTISIGDELIEYTSISGDTISGFTTVNDHDADELAQIALVYSAENVDDIIYDLVVNYSPLDSSRIDLASWADTVSEFSNTLYSTTIVKPTSVESLINELVEQAGLVVYGNTRTQKIEFDVLRPDSVTGSEYNNRRIMSGSFSQADQPKKRYSQVWVFYDQRDIFKNLNEPTNFYSGYLSFPPENNYETDSIKKIYSRWIPKAARSVAEDVASRAIARYVDPPRLFSFGLYAGDSTSLGEVAPISIPSMEGCFGAEKSANCIVTGIESREDSFVVRAEELKFDASLVNLNKTFPLEYSSVNVTLRDIYDNTYSEVDIVNPITFIVSSGVAIGSSSNVEYSLDTGDWPVGTDLNLIVKAGSYIVGKGGDGGRYSNGKDGGPSMIARYPITVTNLGTIGGGGGGGGGIAFGATGRSSGGGGAGRTGGIGHENGSISAGGVGGDGDDSEFAGSGGGLGSAGDNASIYPSGDSSTAGGAAGVAIQGVSYITFVSTGTILGAQVG